MEIHHFESTLGVILKASEHVCRLIIMFKLVASLDISAYKKKHFHPSAHSGDIGLLGIS